MIKLFVILPMVLAITPAHSPPTVCFEPTHLERVIDDSIAKTKNQYMCPKGVN